jgi:hypothetical protein
MRWLCIRQVAFFDGLQLFNTCDNPGCSRTSQQQKDVDDFWATPVDLLSSLFTSDPWGGAAALCRCGQAALLAILADAGGDGEGGDCSLMQFAEMASDMAPWGAPPVISPQLR